MLLAVPIAILALGLVLLTFGLHGRRISSNPHCRRCKFDLQGLAAPAICPECGSDLARPRAVAHSLRKRLPIPLWSGAIVLFLGLTLAGLIFAMAFAGTSANPYKPVWLLRLELDGPRDGKADAAAIELITRLSAGKLSKSAVASLIRDALAHQADTARPWRTAWGEIIEGARTAQLVSDADWARYARQSVNLNTVARRTIRVGDPYCVGLVPDCRTAAKSILHLQPIWWTCWPADEDNPIRVSWDYAATSRPLPQTASQRFANGAPSTSNLGIGGPGQISRPKSPGRTTIKVPVAFIVTDPTLASFNPALRVPASDEDRAADALIPSSEPTALALPPNTLAAWKVVASAPITVVERDAPVITLNRDPQLRAAMKTGAETLRVRIDTSGQRCVNLPANPQYHLETQVGPTPIPVAFKIVIEDPDLGPLPLHSVICSGPSNSHGFATCMRGKLPPQFSRKTVTVRLIPDIDAAVGTLDFEEIWGDEVILDNVPILDAATTTGSLYNLPSTAKAR